MKVTKATLKVVVAFLAVVLTAVTVWSAAFGATVSLDTLGASESVSSALGVLTGGIVLVAVGGLLDLLLSRELEA